MKKRIASTTIVGLLLELLAGLALAFTGKLVAVLKGTQVGGPRFIIENATKFLQAFFGQLGVMSWVILGLTALMLVLVIIQLVMLIRKKHGAAIWVTIAGIIFAALLFAFLTLTFTPGQGDSNALYQTVTIGDKTIKTTAPLGVYMTWLALVQGRQWAALLYFIAPVLFLIGFILSLVGLFSDMKLLADLPKPVKAKHSDDEVVVIHDEDLDSDESRAAAETALANGGYAERHAAAMPAPAAPGVQGPLLIQYINTYAPADNGKARKDTVPVEEIQGNINGEKPLTADDIRKIIQEELEDKKEQPVIVNVPAAPKEEAPKGVTPDEVRKILSEELGRYLAAEKEDIAPEDTEILVEEEPAPALTKEEIRDIIASELAKAKPEPVKEEPKEDIREVIRDELEAHRRELEEEAARKEAEEAEEKARQEELERARAEAAEAARKEAAEEAARKEKEAAEEAARKEAEEAAKVPPVTAEDIRAIVAEELAKKEPEEPKEDIREVIREVIRAELAEAAPVKEEPVEPVKAEPAPVQLPVVNIIVKSNEPEEVKAEPAPAPVVVSEPAPAPAEPAAKIIRVPFNERMASADDELRRNYNELKSEILSYGDVKSRVSNTGDTFRAHTVTFVKITVAGKGLKLYFALDPKDYANSTLPVQDASSKSIYRDIPLVFKVKSELSLRRAKQLIADVMEKNGYEQGKIEKRDWAEELKNYKPAGSKDDDEDYDDD